MKNAYLSSWLEEAAAIPVRVASLFSELTEEQINRRPAEDKWSIGELLDHIMVTNQQYFPLFENVISGKHRNPFLGRFQVLPEFFGQTILNAVEPDTLRKVKTVRKFQPVNRLFTLTKLNDFEKHQLQLMEYARASDRLDHRQVILTSPVARYIVYSLESTFMIILSHELRHINQAAMLRKNDSSHLNVA